RAAGWSSHGCTARRTIGGERAQNPWRTAGSGRRRARTIDDRGTAQRRQGRARRQPRRCRAHHWRATAGGGAVQAVGAGAQLLGREHAQPVSEILLLLVQLVVEQGDLVAQFFIGAGRLRQALGQALDLVLQGLDPVFVGLDLVGELFGLTVLAVFMGLACRFFFVTFA